MGTWDFLFPSLAPRNFFPQLLSPTPLGGREGEGGCGQAEWVSCAQAVSLQGECVTKPSRQGL